MTQKSAGQKRRRAQQDPPWETSRAGSKRGAASSSPPRLAASRSIVAVAPRPIGAAQSASARSLLVLATKGDPAGFFFSGHAYPPRPDGFLQSIELQLKLLGNLRFTGTSRQKLLNLRHHAVNQHRRTACHPRCIKSPRSLLP